MAIEHSPTPTPKQVTVWNSGGRHLDFLHTPPRGHTGDPVMFIHGWGLSARSYLQPIAAMSQWAQVWAPSLPGFGCSSPMPTRGGNSLDGFAAAVGEGWAQGDLPHPMPLVAHSMGSGVAVRLARTHPGWVSSLVLVCPIGGAGSRPSSWLRLAASLASEAHVSFLPRLADAGPSMLRNLPGVATAGWAAKTADLRRDIDTLVDGGTPVTLVVADRDGVVPPGALTASKATVVPVSGKHGWLLRRPAEFADVIYPYVFPRDGSEPAK